VELFQQAPHEVPDLAMTFAKGALLENPSGLFNSSLEGNIRRVLLLVQKRKPSFPTTREPPRKRVRGYFSAVLVSAPSSMWSRTARASVWSSSICSGSQSLGVSSITHSAPSTCPSEVISGMPR
jgi:hypothetical protein